ncbi:uncharacterized protein HKW66_Vig0145810 [Vigna angularis]|uniref:J domain-containing protein n=1 Tax=Phaseolus angularis TaxID=3914 RepID=A0A8T0KFD2_PHAAN|nr:uncharacterized protein HKW66_Vig0145810 [Vigna angularis]
MSMHFVDSLAMFAQRDAEEMFKLGNIKGAITCATMAKTLDPKVDGIDETILAYKIHQAAMKKDDNGATNWYKVLGINKGFEDDIESIKMQHNKLVVMLNPTKKASVATLGAFRLIYNAWRHLTDSNYKNVNLRRKTTPHRNKVTKSACLRCPRDACLQNLILVWLESNVKAYSGETTSFYTLI